LDGDPSILFEKAIISVYDEDRKPKKKRRTKERKKEKKKKAITNA